MRLMSRSFTGHKGPRISEFILLWRGRGTNRWYLTFRLTYRSKNGILLGYNTREYAIQRHTVNKLKANYEMKARFTDEYEICRR